MSKKPNKDEEGVGSFVDPAEIEAQKKEKEAKKLLEQSTNPEAPLFKKLDAIITAINGVAHQLCRIADMKDGVEKKPQTKTEARQAPAPSGPEPPTPQPPAEIASVMDLFPNELAGKLMFEEEGDKIKVSPRQFLGSENFAKIASIVREAGGEYKSAGKNSHFLVPPLGAEQAPSGEAQPAKAGGIKGKFPPVLADMLTFEEAEGKVIVKAKKFLGSDNFAKIATIVREAGGEYISDKKNSRFEVPTK